MSTIKEDKIRTHYDSVAGTYDHHYDHPRGRNYHTHISNYLIKALPEKGDLLDIGCGTGLFVEKYIRHGGTAVGIDISRKMVERARCRCAMCNFAEGNGDALPFRDNSFDAVSSLLVFSYVKEPDAMLSEAYRVLKPGGSIALLTLGKKLLTKGIPLLYQISEKMQVKHVVMKDFGEHYYDEEEMTRLFSDAGFTRVNTRWCSFAHIDMIDPLFNIATKIEPFVEKRVPQLAYNIFVSAKKPED
ncbi:class I SAM-dependent methyltransferase [Methanoregula sp.]|uniref:class I SAM-dependent methyltransferase n=1 Tax=Methanoregula sp. TaxID=2052170 RepID=UPI00236D4C62|nr:class I SAM-dependent methyltransferase [Methanoregula sp.]MDD1686848.1 class I SAM-dependent methyltransferase [Methanoregula sp.]